MMLLIHCLHIAFVAIAIKKIKIAICDPIFSLGERFFFICLINEMNKIHSNNHSWVHNYVFLCSFIPLYNVMQRDVPRFMWWYKFKQQFVLLHFRCITSKSRQTPKGSFFSLSSRKKNKTSNSVVCFLQDVLTCLQTLSCKKRMFSFMAPRKGRNMNFCKTSGEIKEACTAQKKMPTLLWSPRRYQSKSQPPHTFLIILCSNWVRGGKTRT